MINFAEIRPGVLNQDQIVKLKNNVIDNLIEDDVDLSAFDLHLSGEGWQMKGSTKPSCQEDISKICQEYKERGLGDNGPWTLETGRTYIFQLQEYLRLPEGEKFFCTGTGKSSIGRLDVLTRLMANKCASFDTIDKQGYEGSVYLEVTPITFPVRVEEGEALAQLRLFRGAPQWSELKPEELPLYGAMILNEDGQPKTENVTDLTVSLAADEEIIAFGTKNKEEINKNNLVVDLTKGEKSHDPKDFWEPESANKEGQLKIVPERFYILRSKERFELPPDVAVYCHAVSETLGELRIHYAGFVHPGFGLGEDRGTPIIFEVRGHNVDVILRDGETLARIEFYRMSKPCREQCLKDKRSPYEGQGLKLSKYFEDWGR